MTEEKRLLTPRTSAKPLQSESHDTGYPLGSALLSRPRIAMTDSVSVLFQVAAAARIVRGTLEALPTAV